MGEKGVVVGAIIVGYVLVPPLARSWPTLVNGVLILILFASILNRQSIWLPHLRTLSGAVAAADGTPKQPNRQPLTLGR